MSKAKAALEVPFDARSTNDTIEDCKRILNEPASIEEVEAVLARIEPAVAEVSASISDLEERRQQVMLVGGDSELAEVDGDIQVLHRTIDRLNAFTKALGEKVTGLRRNSELENITAQQALVVEHRDVAAALLLRYAELAREAADIVIKVAESEAEVAAFNNALESMADDFGLEEVEGAESLVRKRAGSPEKIVASSAAERLISEYGGDFSGSLENAKFDEERGGWRVRNYDRGAFVGEEIVFRKQFKVETFLPKVSAALPPPLWATVRLPGLIEGDRPFWSAPDHGWARGLSFDDAAARLAAMPEHDVPRVEAQTRTIPVANDGGV